ncbi:MAG: hypothetical protein ABIQ39_08200 [Ilumatobacteraceae bacterium]
MAWDSTRPVPWKRLLREAAVFLVIGGIAFALFLKKSDVGSYVALVIGMLMFLGFSAILAKFGYTRQTLKEIRAQAPQPRTGKRSGRRAGKRGATSQAVAATRPKPAPTRRTSTGPSQRPKSKHRR